MRRVLKIALMTAGLGLAAAATPAQADTCSQTVITASSPTVSASNCVGYYSGNLINTNTQGDMNAALDTLTNTTTWNITYNSIAGTEQTSLDSNGLLSFGTALYGTVIFGVHVGNTGTATDPTLQNQTAFFLFSGLTGQTTINIDGLAKGFSNAVLVENGTPPAVPEPATWAMMLLGFGAMGLVVRSSRRRGGALMQVA